MANVCRNRRSMLGRGKTYSLRTTEKGVAGVAPGYAVGTQRNPADPVGTLTLTLTNVVVGSSYDVEVLSPRSLVVKGTASSSTVVLPISVYAAGNPSNSLVVKVRKSSGSPNYQPYETQVAAAVGAQSLFINQLLDE